MYVSNAVAIELIVGDTGPGPGVAVAAAAAAATRLRHGAAGVISP